MIRLQRSIKVRGAKLEPAMQWAKEITGYINDKFSGANMLVFNERFGDVSTFHWTADFETLSTLEVWQQKLGADQGYQDFITKAENQALFVDGTVYDRILHTLP